MLASTLVLLALAAPAEPAPATIPDPAASAPAEAPRGYDGPQASVADDGVAEPEVIDPSAPVDTAPATSPDGKTPPGGETHGGTTPGPMMPPEQPVTWTPRKRRPIPRALATIDGYGYPASEIATIGKGKVTFTPGIQVRNQVGYVSPFTLDRFGHKYSEGGMTTGRLRWNPTLQIGKKVKLVGMLDAANGRWAPDGSDDPVIQKIIDDGHPPPRANLKYVDPRELYVEARLPFGLLRAGQQAFTWGQGMLANSGNFVDRFGDMRFGDDGRGDIFERVLFATKPFQNRGGKVKDLAIAIGGDLVYRDEQAVLARGDLAGQALLVLRWEDDKKPGNSIGGYAVYRKQKLADDHDVYPNDNHLEVGVVDIAGQGTKWLSDKLQLIGAFEAALVGGKADIARDEHGRHTVLQGGGVVRGYIGRHDRWLVGFDGGYASGDANPNDRQINNFTFDAGHTVGMVLFNQVNAWRSAQTEILATNGQLTGVPLNGTQYIPTRGGVSNALYIHPKARYSIWQERFEIWGGPLIAVAPSPIIDPYTTRLAGGVATNSSNGDGNRRYYGTELDFGVRGRIDIRNFWLMAGLQGGVLLPGVGLANRAGSPDKAVGAIWLRTEIRY
jgi:hypothetical protein